MSELGRSPAQASVIVADRTLGTSAPQGASYSPIKPPIWVIASIIFGLALSIAWTGFLIVLLIKIIRILF
jgi:hypothetical protein